MKPIKKAKSLFTEISNAVGTLKRRRVKENSSSSPLTGMSDGDPVGVVIRQVMADGRKCGNEVGVVLDILRYYWGTFATSREAKI